MSKKPSGRLYCKGVVLGYKRSQRNQYPSQTRIKIQGVEDRASTAFYLGKRVAYVYRAKRPRKSVGGKKTKIRVIWAAAEVAETFAENIRGKVALVTGAYGGLGEETALQICRFGGIAVIAGRNPERLEETAQRIRQQVPEAQIHKVICDLSDMASIRRCAESFIELNLPLHVLINNAGIMACPRALTKDGFETQIGVNHFGHFLLTNLLMNKLIQSAPSRVVIVASLAHKNAYREGIRFDDISGERGYSKFGAYGQSKLANILHAKELNRICQERGVGVTAVSLHPGVIPTELSRHMGVLGSIFLFVGKLFMKTIPQGAATQLYCAYAPDVVGGEYYADCNLTTDQSRLTRNEEMAKKLWEVSVNLTNSNFPSGEQNETK